MQNSNEITILIVDDSLEDRETIKRFLSKSRAFTYRILEAETGEKGFESSRKHIPDCILLDYKLPDIDGINFIKDLMDEQNLKDIPVLLLTGQGDETVATESLKSGAQDYLIKDNLNSDSLMHSIRYAVEKKQAEKTLRENEVKYRQIYNTTFDGIITAGIEGKIIEVNQKAEEIFGYETGEMVGLEIVKLMPERFRENHLAGMKRFLKSGKGKILGTLLELQGLHKNDNIFPIELIVNSFTVAESTYFTGTMRDITERKQLEIEKEKHLKKIKEALNKIKRLEGLLPICSSCKKIRDDKGSWIQIESYIHDHSEADFTHGVCPECIKKLYPELYEDNK